MADEIVIIDSPQDVPNRFRYAPGGPIYLTLTRTHIKALLHDKTVAVDLNDGEYGLFITLAEKGTGP